MLNLSSQARTLVVTTMSAPSEEISAVGAKGADVLIFDGSRPPVRWVLEQLAAQAALSVLVEGGATIHAAILEAQVADRVIAFIVPLIVGGQTSPSPIAGLGVLSVNDAVALHGCTVRQLGQDLMVEGELRYPVRSSVQVSDINRTSEA